MSEWRVVQGDTWRRTWQYYNPLPSGAADLSSPVDLSGWTAKLQVRKEPGSTAVLTLTSDPVAGLTVTGEDGRVDAVALPAATSGVDAGRWRFDVQVEKTESAVVVDRVTLDGGVLTVEPQVTT